MPDQQRGGAGLLRNSALNVAAFAIALLLAALLLPFVVRRIGIGAFGTAGIVLACYAPLQLVGTVLGQSVARELASSGPQAADAPGRLVAAALSLCTAVVLVVLGALCGAWLLLQASGSNGAAATLVPLLLVFFAGWAFQQYALVLQGIAVAAQNYRDVALVTIAAAIASAAGVVLGIHLWPGHSGYLGGLAFGYLASFCIWACVVWFRYFDASSLRRFCREDVARIVRFGKWQAVTQLAGAMGNQMDRYCLGALTSVSTVGRYNIAMRIQEVVYMSVLKAAEVLFPYVASLDRDNVRRQQQVLAVGSFALNTMAACALGPLIVLSVPLVDMWVGSEYAPGAARMLVVLATAGLVGSSINVYMFWAMGTGNNSRLAFMSVAGALVSILVTIASIASWGEVAAGFGVLAGGVAMQVVAIRNVSARLGRQAARRTLVACGWPPLLCGIGVGWLFRLLAPLSPHSWAGLLAGYALVALTIGAVSVLFTALTGSGRVAITDAWGMTRRLAARGN